MTNGHDDEKLARALVDVVCELSDATAPRLLQTAATGRWPELEREWKGRRNYVSSFDLELHAAYRRKLAAVLPSVLYASEEEDGAGDDPRAPEYIAIVDPLDTSELAVRGLAAYTHVLVYSVARQAAVAAVVGDLFHRVSAYWATPDGAFLRMRTGEELPLRPSAQTRLDHALVTNFLMRPSDRFREIAARERFLDALGGADADGVRRGRLGVDFGSVGLCHVAAGFTDAMVEIAKGFALWDFWPGQFILEAAGGAIRGMDGTPLRLDLRLTDRRSVDEAMSGRQKFVAAGNDALAGEIVRALA